MKYAYDQTEAEAYGMLDLVTSFIARYEMYPDKSKKRFKELLGDVFGVDDRANEAALGQFIAQLDHIIKNEGLFT